jgi:hypothetical protein
MTVGTVTKQCNGSLQRESDEQKTTNRKELKVVASANRESALLNGTLGTFGVDEEGDIVRVIHCQDAHEHVPRHG